MSTTRRDFLATSAAAALAATIGRPAFAHAWQQQQGPVFTPIRRNVGFFTMRGGTIGWLVNPGGVAVVDTQFPAEGKACLEGLNTRSNNRPVDYLINTHHHGDHSGGNISFRGSAKKVVAHEKANEHMRQPPGGQPPTDQLFPDTTFAEMWTADVGDEKIVARYYGRAHTSGDVVITFERANIAHMGDLLGNQRHPVVDRAAGASMKNWITVLERTARDHPRDTTFICGHANTGLPVTVDQAALLNFRDYLGAVLAFVESQVKAGKSRDEILAMRNPLKGFESYGAFPAQNAREPITAAYEELTTR
jgi:glyoxylase-like metal-dependent hydrolase (beta-lactamase superfamily II)